MLRAPFPVGSRIRAAAARSVSGIVPYVGDVVGVAQQLGAKLWRIGGGEAGWSSTENSHPEYVR